MLFKNNILFLFLSCMFLVSCTPFAPKQINPLEVLTSPVPDAFDTFEFRQSEEGNRQRDARANTDQDVSSQSTSSKNVPNTPWWESFNSKDLNTLQEKALSQSFDILTAWARLQQSEAVARKSFASLFPQINLGADTSRNFRTTQTDKNAPSLSSVSENFGFDFRASYELDLWGRVSSSKKASDLLLEASVQDVHTAAISVTASVANTWANLLGNRAVLSVLKRQLEVNQSLVEVQELRFANALSQSLDVLQQREILAASKAELPKIEQAAVVLRNQLAVLLGLLPGNLDDVLPDFDENAKLPELENIPDQGLPIELLQMRPDVRASWARLEASRWDISKARAQRFPAINLVASHAYGATDTSLVLRNWTSALMASLALPLFDAGNLAAEERRVRAIAEEAMIAYVKTVSTAIQEVNNAIAVDIAEKATLNLLREQFRLSKSAEDNAFDAYLQGTDTFLRFVTQLKSTQNLERSLAQQEVTVITSRIALYRVLGGLYFPFENIPVKETQKNIR